MICQGGTNSYGSVVRSMYHAHAPSCTMHHPPCTMHHPPSTITIIAHHHHSPYTITIITHHTPGYNSVQGCPDCLIQYVSLWKMIYVGSRMLLPRDSPLREKRCGVYEFMSEEKRPAPPERTTALMRDCLQVCLFICVFFKPLPLSLPLPSRRSHMKTTCSTCVALSDRLCFISS